MENPHFVAIEASYCNKLYWRCNMVAVLRQTNSFLNIATNSYSVEIPSLYYNKMTALTQWNLFVAIPLHFIAKQYLFSKFEFCHAN